MAAGTRGFDHGTGAAGGEAACAVPNLARAPLLRTSRTPGWLRRVVTEPLLHDREGRPLCEGRPWRTGVAPDAAVATDYAPCPYRDSRLQRGARINVGALRQVTRHWRDALGYLAVVAWCYRESCGVETLAAVDLYHLVAALIATPGAAFASGRVSARGLDPVLAVAAKVALGIETTAQLLIEREVRDRCVAPVAALSATDLYATADRAGQLVSPRGGEACAASPATIRRAAEALLGGQQPTGPQRRQASSRLAAVGLTPDGLLRVGGYCRDHGLLGLAFVYCLQLRRSASAGRDGRPALAPAEVARCVQVLGRVAALASPCTAVRPELDDVVDWPRRLGADGGGRAASDALCRLQRNAFARLERGLRECMGLPAPPSRMLARQRLVED